MFLNLFPFFAVLKILNPQKNINLTCAVHVVVLNNDTYAPLIKSKKKKEEKKTPNADDI